jgi:dipeptidyl aminopeptidase/acylaminoacyl peptidase
VCDVFIFREMLSVPVFAEVSMARLRTARALAIVLTTIGAYSLTVTASPQQPAAGRALKLEDYYRIKTVGGAALSPNGRWVSYTVSTRVEEDNGTKSEAWIVPADASAQPRRVQHEGKDVSNPRWTDDDKLQYSVDRQTWRIDPANPAAAPVQVETPVVVEGAGRGGGRGGRGGPPAGVRSPDGSWTAHAVDKPRPKADPIYASDFEKRHQERFKGAIFDWKDFQRDGAPFPAPDPTAQPSQTIVVVPRAGAETKVLLDRDLRPSGLAWHPNSQLIAFTADTDWRNELKYNNPDLWTVGIDSKVTRLTDDGYVYSDVDFSPDGKYLSYARSFGTDMIIDQRLNHGGPRDLYVRPVAGGEPINLTATWDLDPGATRWSPDSRYIYFSTGIGGESHLFRVSVPEGKVEQVTKGARRLNGIGYDKAMTKIVYTVGVHDAPGDVYVAGIDGSNERRLTNVHEDLVREIAFSRAERLQWGSNDRTRIEGWLMFPHGYDAAKGPYPMIVTSHGGPHSATGYSFDFKDQYFAANGYFVFDTNFRSSTGYGDKFKWGTWGAWGDKDGQDVMSGIDYVLKRYPVDPKRVGHTGHSYGGFMTNWLITQYPDRFAAAISGAGISNWISDYGTADIYRTKETEFFGTPWDEKARAIMIRQSPLSYAGRVKTPTLFVHGEVDQRVPYEEAEQLYFALKRRGVPAKMIQYQGQPHGIGGHWNNVHRMLNELAWWEKYLKPVKRPTTNSQ